MGQDYRLIRPFITDADDLFAFENIAQMQSEIQAIRGMAINKIIRLNRFEGLESSRIHYRRISTTDDGSGVPIRINISTDPKVAQYIDAYAVLAVGFPFWEPTDNGIQIVFWDGEKKVVLGESVVRTSILSADEIDTSQSSGFYPNSIILNGISDVKSFQYVENGKVLNISLSDIENDNPRLIEVTESGNTDTSKSFNVRALQSVSEDTVYAIVYKLNKLLVTVKPEV